MDAVKEATILLKLDAKEYARGLAGLDKPAAEAGEKSGTAFSKAFSTGLKGAKSAVEGLYSTIRGGILAFSGVAGMAGTMELARHAMQAEGTYKKLAFQIQAGTGQLVNFREMMEKAKGASTTWGKDVDQLGGAMARMFEETGKADVATGNIDTVAMVARASREDVNQLGSAAGMLSKKFKIANVDMADALGTLLSAANKGGLSFDELSGRLGYIGAIAHEAGMEGKEGLGKIVGMLNVGEESAKNMRKALGTVSSIVEEFGKAAPRNKMLMQLGISPSSVKGGLDETMKAVIAKTGGAKEKLQVAFKNEAQVEFLVDMGKSYAKAYADTAGTVKQKATAAAAALDEAMKHAAKSHMNESTLRDIATKNMQSGQAKMDAAIEKMKAAFMRPEVTSAIGRLADVLPILADRMVAAVDLFAKHPMLSGASILGGTALKGAAGSMLSSSFAALGPTLLSSLGAGGTAAGASAATSMAAGAPAVGAAVGGGFLAAGTLAAAGIGLAIWQGYELSKDLKEKEVVDSKGKTVKPLGPKESQASFMWKELKHDLGITSDKEYDKQWSNRLGRGVGGFTGSAAARRTLERQTGSYGESADELVSYEAEAKRVGRDYTGTGARKAAPAPPPPPKPVAGRSKEDAALLAEMLSTKTLKVKIDAGDIAALQKGGMGGGGSPAPGYVDRP